MLHPGSVDRRGEGDYDQVFQVTLEVLRDRQLPIARADRGVAAS